mmetsp:Transcript_84585/g.159421  ORF Transcript_84585/g.159421 Transcript_84585/m.159421 type:complete len:120 (+) Transcript_84585:13-372(+)
MPPTVRYAFTCTHFRGDSAAVGTMHQLGSGFCEFADTRMLGMIRLPAPGCGLAVTLNPLGDNDDGAFTATECAGDNGAPLGETARTTGETARTTVAGPGVAARFRTTTVPFSGSWDSLP